MHAAQPLPRLLGRSRIPFAARRCVTPAAVYVLQARASSKCLLLILGVEREVRRAQNHCFSSCWCPRGVAGARASTQLCLLSRQTSITKEQCDAHTRMRSLCVIRLKDYLFCWLRT
jgi:hypothetical protein